MKKRQVKPLKQGILDHLDDRIRVFKEKTGEYPSKIFCDLKTHKKLFEELKIIDITESWIDKEDNYRGILLEIKRDIFIELE